MDKLTGFVKTVLFQ